MVNAEWFLGNIVGNFGVFLILTAYFSLSLGKLTSKGMLYSFINLCGSLFIGISLFYNFNLPSVVIEVCWSSISLFGLGRAIFRKLRERKSTSSQTHKQPSESGSSDHKQPEKSHEVSDVTTDNVTDAV